MTSKEIFYLASRPDFKSEHIATFQNAKQIIQQMQRAELDSRGTSKALAKAFYEPYNKKLTAAKVWYFLRNEVPYEAEPETDQNAKTIRRILADAKRGVGNDCKHYSTFAVGVLNACGIPCWFTFAGQDEKKKKPNHAYATALIDGKKVVIDPCREFFNSECRHFYRWDFKRK